MFVTREQVEVMTKQTSAHCNEPCFLGRMRISTDEREADAVIMSESQRREKVYAFDYADIAYPCNLDEFEGVVHCAHFFDCPSLLDRIQDRLSPHLAAIKVKSMTIKTVLNYGSYFRESISINLKNYGL